MRVTIVLCVAVMLGSRSPASGQILPVDSESARRLGGVLREVDFEGLSAYQFSGTPGQPALPNPLRLEGVTLSDPHTLQIGFCSSPTCQLDPDNAQGGNIVTFLNPGATLMFDWAPAVVMLDVQGMGDNPFTVVASDRTGARVTARGQGELFGVGWLALWSPTGIDTVELQEVGGNGGPLVVSRVLFSDVPEPSTRALLLAAAGLGLAKGHRLVRGRSGGERTIVKDGRCT